MRPLVAGAVLAILIPLAFAFANAEDCPIPYAADFATTAEWGFADEKSGGHETGDGELKIWANDSNHLQVAWAAVDLWCPQGFVLSSTAHLTTDVVSGSLGFALRNVEGTVFYVRLQPAGFFRVERHVDEESLDVPVVWTPCPSLNPGLEPNEISLFVGEGDPVLAVNGERVADLAIDLGDVVAVGLFAASQQTVPIGAAFSAFTIETYTDEALDALAASAAFTAVTHGLPFSDDFDDEGSGWEVSSYTSGHQGYVAGEYAIWLEKDHMSAVAFAPISELPEDGFVVEATAYRASGASDAGYGIYFGESLDDSYRLQVTVDGYYRVLWKKSGEWEPSPVPWTASSLVRREGEANEVAFVIADGTAALLLNGEVVGSIDVEMDGPFHVGVLAMCGAQAPSELRYTSFAVREATASDLATAQEASAETAEVKHPFPFTDEFESADTGWPVGASENRSVSYVDGELAFRFEESPWNTRSWAPLEDACPDAFVIEAAGRKVSGPDNVSRLGLVWGLSNSDYYLFYVSGDGFYRVLQLRKGQWQDDPVRWTFSDAIRQGDSLNELRVLAVEDRATIFVNETRLTSIPLEMPGPYDVGLAAGTGSSEETPVEARFSNFSVRTPTEAELAALQEEPPASTTPTYTLPLAEDFDDPESGWQSTSTADGVRQYADGEYSIRVDREHWTLGAWAPLTELVPEPFVIEAVGYAEPGSAVASAQMGLLLGLSSEDYYYFYVSTDGFYRVLQIRKGQRQDDPVRWTPSDAIHQESVANVLRVVVSNGVATFEANGATLTALNLDLSGPYKVGVFGAAGETCPAEIRYTGFSVREATEDDLALPEEAPAAVEPPTHALPFSDDFDDPESGWGARETDTGGTTYRDGEYAIWVDDDYRDWRAWSPLAEPIVGAFVVEVSGYKHSGADDAEIGLVWGYSNNDLYVVRVSADGFYKIAYKRKSVWQDDPVEWTQSSHIHQGGESNALKLVISEGQATVLANGEVLTTLSLALEGPYKVALLGGSDESFPVELRYTSFSVREAMPADLSLAEEAPAEAVAPTYALPFRDDFDDPQSGWGVSESETGGTAYRDGEYAIWVDDDNRYWRTWSPLSEPIAGAFVVEAEGYKLSGANDASLGLLWGLDADDFYLLYVSADGFYRVSYKRKGVWQERPVDWTPSVHIHRGSEPNALKLLIADGQATIFVNEEILTTLAMDLEGPFRIGMMGSADDSFPVELRFTSFSVREATEADLSGVQGTQPEPAAPVHALPFHDDFDDPQSGWASSESETGGKGYVEGEYAFWLDDDHRTIWSWAPVGEIDAENFTLRAEAHAVRGGDSGKYGFVVGSDSDNAYFFQVWTNWQYKVSYRRNGEWQEALVPWTPDWNIEHAEAMNSLRLAVSGDTATLFVNGSQLTTVQLELPRPYRVGLLGASHTVYPAEVRIVNFSASQESLADRDGDGVPDEIDFCPDYPGDPAFDGC